MPRKPDTILKSIATKASKLGDDIASAVEELDSLGVSAPYAAVASAVDSGHSDSGGIKGIRVNTNHVRGIVKGHSA